MSSASSSRMTKRATRRARTSLLTKENHTSFNPLGRYPGFVGLRSAGAVHKVIGQGSVPSCLTISSISPQYYSRYFVAGDLDNFSSLSAVFDQYRITQIDCWLIPSVATNTDGAQTVADIYSAVDLPISLYNSANCFIKPTILQRA